MTKNCKKFTKFLANFAKKFKLTEFFAKNAEFKREFHKKFTQSVNLWILRLFYKKAQNDKDCVNLTQKFAPCSITPHIVRQCKFSQKIHKKAKK